MRMDTELLEKIVGSEILDDVREWVVENTRYKLDDDVQRYLEGCTAKEILKMWLEWNGIVGYDEQIWKLVVGLIAVELAEK